MITEMENHLAILGFLLLVGAYGLASDFDKNELENLCCTVAQHWNVTPICHAFGISVITRPMSQSNGEPLSDNVERSCKLQNLISSCASSIVHSTSDPAKIVLDALRKCFSAEWESSGYVRPKKSKRRKSKDAQSVVKGLSLDLSQKFMMRFSDLLEQLREVSPEIRSQVKVEATEFAVEWRATLIDPWEVLAFLQLLATFELSSSFDSNDLIGLLEIVQHKRRAIKLIKILGLADKIPCFIENLIGKGELVLAFTYIYELELVDSFSPVLLLENYVRHSTEQAKKMRNWRHKVQKKVKAAVECIEQHRLQSGYSHDELRTRILEIERLMEKPNESPCAQNPHATGSSGGCTSVIPNSSHFTQHYVPDPTVQLSNFRGPALHPSLLDAPPGQFRNYSAPTDHFIAHSGFIQNLIAKQQHVEAVKYAYAFDLVDHFTPVLILKDYFKQVMKVLENVCNRETCSLEEKNEAIDQSVASIRAIIACIVDHKLQSQYPPTQLEECIESLTRQKADTTAPVISEAQKPQQTQLTQMASTCPSVPADTKAFSSTSSSEETSTCKLGHSDAFAIILVGMGGKNLQTFLNDHWAELELLRIEVSRALKISTDSGMLVLEALGGFYPPEPHKEEIEFNHSIIRKSCILLLEQLMRISPEITPKARLEASRLASDWKAKMITEMENHLAILGFLLLAGAYGLASDFDKNELESLCCSIPKHANVTLICHVLGISVIKRPISHSNGEPLSDIVERRSKQQNIISGCTSSVIHCASDPAKIVLDALRKCYYAELKSSRYVRTKKRKRGKSKDASLVMERLELSLAQKFVKRFSDVLEQLREVSPEIRPQVKVGATQFAVEWRAALIDPLEGLAFLQLLATFQLSSSFDSDDLVGVLEIVQRKKKAISLIKILGLADKIPCFIKNLIRKEELLLAFTYIYEFELVGSFSPVLLLKNYVLHSREQAKQTHNGCCPREVQNKVKAAVKSIEQHGIQSGYSPDELRLQILEIERLMARPHERPCALNPHAGDSSHFTPHFVPDPRVRPSNFRAPTLHPSLFLQHNRLDAPPGGMFRNFSGPTDHFLAPSGVPRPLPIVNPFYHQRTPCSPNVIHPSYLS